jgi:mannose-1-phosphate guanylyltransferase
MAEHDPRGNAIPPGAVTIEAHGNLVKDLSREGHRKRWALLGVHDLVIVETDDAVLIMPRARAQDVRVVVEALENLGATDLL